MFDNEINLLKKDILSRFGEDKPLYVDFEGEKCTICEVDWRGWFHLNNGAITGVVNLKPYLRPMSSMTEEERKTYNNFIHRGHHEWDGHSHYTDYVDKEELSMFVDWLNSHYFDWRGLIPLDLALEAKKGMYK